MLKLWEKHGIKQYRTAGQPGINGVTANGACVPIFDFKGWGFDLRIIDLQELGSRYTKKDFWLSFRHDLSTSIKGAKAVLVVKALLQDGHFPLWLAVAKDANRSIQVAGADILVYCKHRIQVKCDYFAGDREGMKACTGNLYLQTSECNPRGLH
jgi:hypothetical protein